MRSKRMTKVCLGLAAAAVVVSAGGVSNAKLAGYAAAIPGSASAGYATPRVVVQKGSVTFYNYDILLHDLDSTTGLWNSPVIGFGKKVKITATSTLKKGTYGFYCSLHPNMKGSIIVR